ncbi:MAG: hypothetical protein HQK49_00005 [Oligoflexia bacterium]|nr:hypothetical protein [Oligoflexia bacterium]
MEQYKHTRKTIFRQAALLRLEEAEFLKLKYPSGCIYLGGYALECMLKYHICTYNNVLYLEELNKPWLFSNRGHDLNLLLKETKLYEPIFKSLFLSSSFNLANKWRTSLRYNPNKGNLNEARRFISAIIVLIEYLNSK